ncbi:MAG TPA: rod shape-determining protein RodA [Ignavibacteriales bacterium]|nr:rod shape-determining protein RodA [Ignavibacteriales bacterium]
MRIDYKLQDKFDLWLIFPALMLICIGLAAIYSSTINHPSVQSNFQRQLTWGIISVIAFFIIYSLPTNSLKYIGIPAYVLSILLLIAVLLIGRKVSGAKSWLYFSGIGFQPSEFAKIGTIFAIAAFLSRSNSNIESLKDIAIALAIGLLPVALILLEPDMGTSITFLGLILILLFWKGISLFGLFVVLSPGFVALSSLFGVYYFIGAFVIVLFVLLLFQKDILTSGSILALNLGAGFFTEVVFKALSPHQQNRIQSFIDPGADPLGAGYNAIQAKVAIGSGGLFGKGFLAGNQTQLQFIPEQWTDFIFCVVGEEFGFIGSFFVLGLFMVMILRILKIATLAKDEFLSLVLVGILVIYFIHLMINIGMVVGIMPIIGIPLPFVSYGGSSLVVNMLLLGIAANIYRTRKNYT